MRRMIIPVSLLLLVIVFGCSKEHTELLKSFPLPVVQEARLTETAPDQYSVAVAWTYADAAYADSYRVYLGATVVQGTQVLDTTSLVTTVATLNYTWDDVDPAMLLPDDELCANYGVCDTMYTYHNFRVSPVTDGVEGDMGPLRFITR
ncbi:MAG: hypothetical protein GY835_06330 [bacterium]|nr:hypothetical protein [bacterium]